MKWSWTWIHIAAWCLGTRKTLPPRYGTRCTSTLWGLFRVHIPGQMVMLWYVMVKSLLLSNKMHNKHFLEYLPLCLKKKYGDTFVMCWRWQKKYSIQSNRHDGDDMTMISWYHDVMNNMNYPQGWFVDITMWWLIWIIHRDDLLILWCDE